MTTNPESLDEHYMKLCIALAQKARGKTFPNPMVGAVIVKEGSVIGQGYHRLYGRAHAEVNAMASTKKKMLLFQGQPFMCHWSLVLITGTHRLV